MKRDEYPKKMEFSMESKALQKKRMIIQEKLDKYGNTPAG